MKTKLTNSAAAAPAEGEGFAHQEWVPARTRRTWSTPRMRADPGYLYLTYDAAAAAAKVLLRWGRVVMEFVVDRETGLPRSIRITPAQSGSFGYKVRRRSGRRVQRTWLSIPVRDWLVVPGGPRPVVEETVSESEIVVNIPFEFKLWPEANRPVAD